VAGLDDIEDGMKGEPEQRPVLVNRDKSRKARGTGILCPHMYGFA